MKMGIRILGAMAGAWLLGCSSEPVLSPSPCPDADQISGVCVGVPPNDLCGGDSCTEGVVCASVVAAHSDAELTSKAAAASSGDCLALAPGHYGAVSLPGGVSLLGRSADAVMVDSITMAAGAGAVVRGLAVGSDGVEVKGATGVRFESIRVTGDPAVSRDGIALDPGSSASVVTSTIDGAGRIGVFAKDADVTLDRCIVSGAHFAGVWIQGSHCSKDCACESRPTLTIKTSLIRDNHVLGLSAQGAAADLESTYVTNTKPGDTVLTAQLGAGVAVSSCSNFTAKKQLRVLDSADWGILVDGSTATLGEETTPDEKVEISRNQRGLWIQNVVQNVACLAGKSCVMLHGGEVADNRGVGIGVAGSSRGIVFCKSIVSGTVSVPLFSSKVDGIGTGAEDVGDGLSWLDGSEVTIEALTLSGNERQSLLIDGPASGRIMSMTLAGGDEGKPALQQKLPMGGAQPMLGNGVSLATQVSRQFAVPLSIGVPALP